VKGGSLSEERGPRAGTRTHREGPSLQPYSQLELAKTPLDVAKSRGDGHIEKCRRRSEMSATQLADLPNSIPGNLLRIEFGGAGFVATQVHTGCGCHEVEELTGMEMDERGTALPRPVSPFSSLVGRVKDLINLKDLREGFGTLPRLAKPIRRAPRLIRPTFSFGHLQQLRQKLVRRERNTRDGLTHPQRNDDEAAAPWFGRKARTRDTAARACRRQRRA